MIMVLTILDLFLHLVYIFPNISTILQKITYWDSNL